MTQVFISYSRKDLSFVEQLASDLKNVGLDVWYDLSGLEGGMRWRREIEKAIRESKYVIVVLSPDSVASDWVEREYLFASNLQRKIIPLLYRPCELPLGYLNLHYINVQKSNYKQNYNELLRALDIQPAIPEPITPPPVQPPRISTAQTQKKKSGWVWGFGAIVISGIFFGWLPLNGSTQINPLQGANLPTTNPTQVSLEDTDNYSSQEAIYTATHLPTDIPRPTKTLQPTLTPTIEPQWKTVFSADSVKAHPDFEEITSTYGNFRITFQYNWKSIQKKPIRCSEHIYFLDRSGSGEDFVITINRDGRFKVGSSTEQSDIVKEGINSSAINSANGSLQIEAKNDIVKIMGNDQVISSFNFKVVNFSHTITLLVSGPTSWCPELSIPDITNLVVEELR